MVLRKIYQTIHLQKLMATKLNKPVIRELLLRADWHARSIYIVTLEPGGMISFRQKGKKKSYSAPLLTCLDIAVKHEMINEYKQRMEDYQHKKAIGYKRLRKPRKPKF
jgi:hypothetical protein